MYKIKRAKKKYTDLEYKEAFFNPEGIKWDKMTKKQKMEFANKVSGEHY
jgi:hypothetical protein